MKTTGKKTPKGSLTVKNLSDEEARRKYGGGSLIFVRNTQASSKKPPELVGKAEEFLTKKQQDLQDAIEAGETKVVIDPKERSVNNATTKVVKAHEKVKTAEAIAQAAILGE